MQKLGDIRKHFFLTTGMAKHAGVDLGDAIREGHLTREGYAECVTRCRHCTNPGHCAEWLPEAQDSDPVPDYCENRAIFHELKKTG